MDSANGLIKLMSTVALIVGASFVHTELALASSTSPAAQTQVQQTAIAVLPDLSREIQGYVPPDNGAPEGTEGAGTR